MDVDMPLSYQKPPGFKVQLLGFLMGFILDGNAIILGRNCFYTFFLYKLGRAFMPLDLKLLKKWLTILLVGWVVFITGLSPVQQRAFKVNPEDSVVQEVVDGIGANAGFTVNLSQLEQRLHVKPFLGIPLVAWPLRQPDKHSLLASICCNRYFLHALSRGPPVRFG
jgi:hypothetical protein